MNFYIAFFTLNQNIFSKLFELINCQSFTFDESSSESFLKNYLGIQCYDHFHFIWIFAIIIPFFIFYGLIVPASTIYFSYYKRNELKIESNIIKYDFLMRQMFIWKNSSLWFI